MTNSLHSIASASASNTNIFSALGIDWKMLIFQAISFVILVWLLGKFVFPVLMKQVDERQAKIEESTKAAVEAQKNAESAEKEVANLLAIARKEARDIVSTAKDEATVAVEVADAKASDRAKKIVASAHEQIEKDVLAAKKTLHNEMIDLVAAATETVLGKTVTAAIDKKVVSAAIKEAE